MRKLVTAVVITAIVIAAAFLFRPEMDLLYDKFIVPSRRGHLKSWS